MEKYTPNDIELPEGAERKFKGVLFDVYQWPQKMFDGSEKMFECITRRASIHAIPVVGDKILIQEQQQPHQEQVYLSLPGGQLDPGENALKGAQRELLEESGYVSDNWDVWHLWKGHMIIQWKSYFYIARNCKKVTEQQLDVGEKIVDRLVSFEEFLGLATQDQFRDHIFKYLLAQVLLKKGAKEELQKRIFQ